MSKEFEVAKDLNGQGPIPTAWRETLSSIVRAFRGGDYKLLIGISGVLAPTPRVSKSIEDNIKDYGAVLVDLPEVAWDTSVCQWMGGYWDALIDLFIAPETASDLVLSIRVRESDVGYVFEVLSVHVP